MRQGKTETNVRQRGAFVGAVGFHTGWRDDWAMQTDVCEQEPGQALNRHQRNQTTSDADSSVCSTVRRCCFARFNEAVRRERE